MRCKRCLLTDKVIGAKFDGGVCNFCRETRPLITDDMRKRGMSDFKRTIEKLRKHKGPYDCIIACSGGKDSAYLMYLLKKVYKLRPLAITIDTGFLSETAKDNIANILSRLSIDHFYIHPEKDIYHKMYRHYLKNYDDSKLIMYTICRHCTDIMDMHMAKIAIEKNIPAVFIGISPDEYRTCINMFKSKDFFYSPSKTTLLKELSPKVFEKILGKEILKKIDITKLKDKLPRFIYPLHVLPYNIENIYKVLDKEGLIPKESSSPYKTNCLLNWVMIYSFIKRKGYNPYLEMFSDAVRANPSLRARYILLDIFITNSVHMGFFKKSIRDDILSRLGMEEKDII